MKELVSIIIPVRSRVEKLINLIGMIRKNTHYKPYEIIVVADKDDHKIQGLIHDKEMKDVHWLVRERDGYVRKTNAGFKVAKGKYFQVFGDDVEPQEYWLTNALLCFKKAFPDGIGVLAMDDGQYQHKLAIHPFVSRKWINAYQHGKWFQWPEYIHWHGDLELTLVAKAMKKFVYCPKARAPHIRAMKIGERDMQWWYVHMNFWTRDSSIFEARGARGFPEYGPRKMKLKKEDLAKALAEARS